MHEYIVHRCAQSSAGKQTAGAGRAYISNSQQTKLMQWVCSLSKVLVTLQTLFEQ